MFSVDILPDIFINRKLNGINIYIAGLSDHPTGFCYFLDEERTKYKNHYDFFEPKKRMEAIIAKIKSSCFVDFSIIKLSEVLLPELIDCKTICIANKQENDCLYYSGVNVDQFLFFLKKLERIIFV